MKKKGERLTQRGRCQGNGGGFKRAQTLKKPLIAEDRRFGAVSARVAAADREEHVDLDRFPLPGVPETTEKPGRSRESG